MYSFLVTGIMKLFDINIKNKKLLEKIFYVNRVIQIFFMLIELYKYFI